jgi:hypothetical protein
MNARTQDRLTTLATALGALVALLVLAVGPAAAGDESFEIDNRFRAKIAKEKVKQAALERKLDQLDRNSQGKDRPADCGSQQIGNVNTQGRPGAQPREVFVFAPNAINIVTPGGCR